MPECRISFIVGHMLVVPVPLPAYTHLEEQYLSRVELYEGGLARLHKDLESLFPDNELKVVIKHRVRVLPEGTNEIIPTDLMGIRIVCLFLNRYPETVIEVQVRTLLQDTRAEVEHRR